LKQNDHETPAKDMMMAPTLSFRRLGCSLLLMLLLLTSSTVYSEEESTCSANNEDPSPPPPKSCRLLLTQRPLSYTNNNNNNGRILNDEYNYRKYGIYSATTIPKNHPLTPLGGDLVIHLVDVHTSTTTTASTTDATAAATNDNTEEPSQSSSSSNQLLKWYQYGYLQEASSSGYGGNYEGLGTVYSVLPGVAMLASSPPSSTTTTTTTAAATTASTSDNNNINNNGSENNDKPINLRPNIWASIPENDNGDHIRYQSPLAGSFTSYYNLTFQVTSPTTGLHGGSEIWMDRFGWYREAAKKKTKEELLTTQNDDEEEKYKIDIDQLFQHGSCLDNIYPTHTSKYGYGRGALSSRYLAKGSIVAPVPVLPVPRDELRYLRVKEWKRVDKFRMKRKKKEEGDAESSSGGDGGGEEDDEMILPPDMKWRDQLLLNYCYGHVESSVLLFPYGLFVNYINHAPSSHDDSESSKGGPVANVKLRWSERLMNTTSSSSSSNNSNNDSDLRTLSPTQLWEHSTRPDGLILELVATRDIQPDEEILLDYGSIWSQSWKQYNDQYGEMILKLADDHALETEYSQAYIMDEAVTNLRTAEEQVSFPYADNVFTACFYRYDVNNDDEDADDESKKKKKMEEGTTNKGKTQATPWKMTPGLFDMTNLRPCKVISREPANDRFATQINDGRMPQGEMVYTAIIQNRPGLPLNERIPKGTKHVVSGIPRGAFRFVDRPYTTDVHLDGVFRHNIGVEEMGLYPEAWLDLKKSK
jgi:hypothetical protein